MIKPEELALIKGYTVTKEGILLNRNGKQVKGKLKARSKITTYLTYELDLEMKIKKCIA